MAKKHEETFQGFLKDPASISRALRSTLIRGKKSALARKLEKGSAPAMQHAVQERLRATTASAPIWTALSLDQLRRELKEKQSLAPVSDHIEDYVGRFASGTEAMAMLAYFVMHEGFSPFSQNKNKH